MRRKYPVKQKPHRSAKLMLVTALTILAVLIILTAGFNVINFALTRFADGFFYPYLKISVPSHRLSDTTLLMQDKSTLAMQVDKLTNANRQLALQSQAASGLFDENRQLRKMLSLKQSQSAEFIIGEIMLRDPLHFREGFTVGRGRRDGVVSGAAVVDVTSDGKLMLIGVVSEVGSRSCKVTTIVNTSLQISGRIGSNGEIGFTNTGAVDSSRERINFGMLPARDDYIHGGVVTTTGFEKGIPEGIKIGELHTFNALRSYAREEYNCELAPAVRFESLRFVAIVKLSGEEPEERQ